MSMLKHKLTQDMLAAMKSKDTVARGVLSILKSNVINEEIKVQRPLTDDEELTILNRERKQIKDSIGGFTKANRHDLIGKEELKLSIVESYLPKQLTDDEITSILDTKGIAKGDNAGKWIGILSKELKGQVDGKTLAGTIKNYISKL